jgi:hypothetical protein
MFLTNYENSRYELTNKSNLDQSNDLKTLTELFFVSAMTTN